MKDRAKSPKRWGCPQGRRLREAFLEEEPSLDKEIFLAHASSCPYCRKKLELIEKLRSQLAPQLEQVPGTSLDRKETRHLRKVAYKEISRISGRPAGHPLFRRFSLRHLAIAGLVLSLALGASLLLNRSGSRDTFRDTLPPGQDGLSPQGLLKEKPAVFEWSPVPEAASYSFELINDDLELLAQGERSCRTRFTLSPEAVQKLTTGRTYIWTVKAYDDKGSELGERSADFTVP
ncbi:MAG: hypothetical protein WCB96_04435 [Candidatus Aminicenantales bacterium]